MAAKTRRIPQSSWDRHKETIIDLYLNEDYSTAQLVQTMQEQHDFSATTSQFEAQLKVWNVRKNLKSHEWEALFDKIDNMPSSNTRYRVSISGHRVSPNRIHRAKRYLKSGRPHGKGRERESILYDTAEAGPANDVLIEVQGLGGEWAPYMVTAEEDTTVSELQAGHSQTLDVETHNHLAEPSVGQVGLMQNITSHEFAENSEQSGIISVSPRFSFSEYDFTFDEPFPIDVDQYFPEPMDISSINPVSQIPQLPIERGLEAIVTSQTLELTSLPQRLGSLARLSPYASWLENLPFERFERDLTKTNVSLTISPSPMQDCQLLFGTHKLVAIFLNEAAAAMTRTNEKPFDENFYNAGLTLRTLETIIPRTQDYENNSMVGTRQETAEVELHRLLLCSAANGFIGMDNVPIATVLSFLDHNSNVTSLLPRFLRGNTGPVAKSLAENLFRAAIESRDYEKTKFFLQTKLVNVDTTFCHIHGKKYTPLERAAELQELKIVRELLLYKPNVNQTFLQEPDYDEVEPSGSRRPLGCMIRGACCEDLTKRNHSTFPLEYLDIVDKLIEAGAYIDASFIIIAIRNFVRVDLAEKLLLHFAPGDHSAAFSNGFHDSISNRTTTVLASIVEEFADEDAKKAVVKILSDCEQTGCRRCLIRFSEKVNDAIVICAKRGLNQVTQFLFPYAKSPTQILSAAIRGANRELIDFVLAQKPDIRQDPAIGIGSGYGDSKVTPLSEAIEAGDSVLISTLEREGALENLDHGYRFNLALSAAIGVGNFDYAKTLLSGDFPPEWAEMKGVLLKAVGTQREDIAQFLLDQGRSCVSQGVQSYILTGAYKRGNKSINSIVMSFHPKLYHSMKSEDFLHELEVGNMDLFNYFRRSGRFTRASLTMQLKAAVNTNNSTMLRQLLNLGADPTFDYLSNQHSLESEQTALRSAAKGRPDMLRILLEYVPPTEAPILGFGTDAVNAAIRQGLGNMEALNMLLACKAIDIHTELEMDDGSPLAVAIEKDAASSRSDFPFTTRLLDAGCDINGVVSCEWERCRNSYVTPLLAAIMTRNKSLVQFLIERGANFNQEAINGIKQTPLQAAAEIGSLDIVKLLLQYGVDIDAKPAKFGGGTALQYAASSGNCNIAILLLEHGASLDSPPSMFYGRWPLEGAAEHGRLDMIQFLWNVNNFVFPLEQCLKAIRLAEGNGHGACKDLVRNLAVLSGVMPTLEGTG